jgi:hypothetical protein
VESFCIRNRRKNTDIQIAQFSVALKQGERNEYVKGDKKCPNGLSTRMTWN